MLFADPIGALVYSKLAGAGILEALVQFLAKVLTLSTSRPLVKTGNGLA